MSIETIALLVMPVGSVLLGLFVAAVAMRAARKDMDEDAAKSNGSQD